MIEIICGAGGFLGSNLRQHLEDKGKRVVALPVEMLLDVPAMHEFLKEHEPYHLYYLATYGNLHGQDNIREIYQACVIKLLNLLTATKDTVCEGMVTAGTTSEYGNKAEPMKEDQLLEPYTFYASAKAGATHLASVWAKTFNFPIVTFRPASITGVGEQSIHLIPTLIRSCVQGEAIPFVSEPVHDFINVKDVCIALEILADNAINHAGEIFNVGTGRQYENGEVKEMVEEITKKKANIIKSVKLNPKNLSLVWTANSDKLQALGWKPKVSLYQNLKEMVKAL